MDVTALFSALVGGVVGAVLALAGALWQQRRQQRGQVRALTREIVANAIELAQALKRGHCPFGWFQYEVWNGHIGTFADVLSWEEYLRTAWFYQSLRRMSEIHAPYHQASGACEGITSEEAQTALRGIMRILASVNAVWKDKKEWESIWPEELDLQELSKD